MAIARNITGSNVPLDDLGGITVLAGQDYDLSLEPAEVVANSQDLINAINADQIVLLDAGGTPLSKTDSLTAAAQTDNDRYVAITAADTTPDYLGNKISVTAPITLTTVNPGVDELLDIDFDGALNDLNNVNTSPVDGQVLTYQSGTSTWVAATPPGAAGGEANTASNQGVGGVGVFIQKTGVDLEFKNINAGSGKIIVTDDAGNNEIDIDIDESQLVLQIDQLTDVTITGPIADNEILAFNSGTNQWINQTYAEADVAKQSDLTTHIGDGTIHFTEASISHLNIQDKGTNTHAQIDSHIADTGIHYAKSSILINDLGDIVVTTPADNEILAYDAGTGDWINQTPAEAGISIVGHTHLSSEIIVPQISGAAYTHIEEALDTFHSAGKIDGGDIINNGDGTVTVQAGNGFVRLLEDATETLYTISWPETVLDTFPLDQDSFVEVTVTAGVADVYHTFPRPSCDTNIHLGIVYNDSVSGTLFVNDEIGFVVGDHARRMINRLQSVMRYQRESGAVISEVGTRNIAITAGTFWEGLSSFNTPPFDSSAAGTFGTVYSDGAGGWTVTFGQTQFSNTQYDDGTGTLANLTPGNYGVHWVFLETNGGVFVHYGVGDYASLQDAQDAPIIPMQHPAIENHARMIGKIIILQGATNATSVESAFDTTFTSGGATDHNDLLNNGTNTHVQIDLHIASTSNPHSTTVSNLTDTNIVSPANNHVLAYVGGQWVNTLNRLSSVSGNDTTPNFLENKLVAGAGVQLNILNEAGNEQIEIQNLAGAPNLWLTFNADTGTTSADTTTDTLSVIGGTGISTSITGDTLTITNTAGATDELVKITAADTTSGYLDAKLTVGTGLAKAIVNPAGDEDLQLSLNAALDDLNNVNAGLPTTDGHVLTYDITAGEWQATQTFVAGQKQTIQSTFGTIAALSGTTDNPITAGAPLITDGSQAWSATFTPTAVDSEIKITVSFAFAISNAAQNFVATVFRDSTPVGAMVDSAANSNNYQTVSFTIKDPGPFVAGVPVTYSMRVGRAGGNVTWYVNTNSAGEVFGTALSNNAYTIEEVVIL